MDQPISLDGRTLVGVTNADTGEVSPDTRFEFHQDGDQLTARYAGGPIVDGFLLGRFDGRQWDVRYVQLNTDGETATGHSVGDVTRLDDGRIRVEDRWEWESKPGHGSSVLEEIET